MHRTPACALVAAALAALLLVPPGAAQAATPATTYAKAAFQATNHQRVEHDRRTLDRSDCLRRLAVRHAKRMATQERMYHQDLGKVQDKCAMGYVGENVAYGYPSGRKVVNQGWMHSEGHRANILNRYYRRMGIGARKGDDGNWYVAQLFGKKL